MLYLTFRLRHNPPTGIQLSLSTMAIFSQASTAQLIRTRREPEYFANNGFITIKPDYRGNGNSELDNQALMRFAYPIDVLNLIASVGNIPQANQNKIFLWSHSMGGEVSLEVLEIASKKPELSSKIKAAVFWAPVTDPDEVVFQGKLAENPRSKNFTISLRPNFCKSLGTPEKIPRSGNLFHHSIIFPTSTFRYFCNIRRPIRPFRTPGPYS